MTAWQLAFGALSLSPRSRSRPHRHNVSPEQLHVATSIAIKWAKKNLSKNLVAFTLHEFHSWIKQAQREPDSHSVRLSSISTTTTAATGGDNQREHPILHPTPPATDPTGWWGHRANYHTRHWNCCYTNSNFTRWSGCGSKKNFQPNSHFTT